MTNHFSQMSLSLLLCYFYNNIYSHCQRLKMQYNKLKVILSFFTSTKQILTKITYFQTILNKYKDVCSISKCIQMIFVAYFLQEFCLARLSIISIFHSRCIQNCIFRNNSCLHYHLFCIVFEIINSY